MVIENVKINEIKLNDLEQYSKVLQFIHPIENIVNGKEKKLTEYTYDEVSLLKRNIQKNTWQSLFTCFDIVFSISKEDLLNLPIIEFYKYYNFIILGLENIIKLEDTHLSNEDEEWKLAGGDKLKSFGEYAVYYSIGKDLSIKPNDVANWKWIDVFLYLSFSKKNNEVLEMYNKIKYNKK